MVVKETTKKKGVKGKGVTLQESKRKEVKRKEVTLQQESKNKWKAQVNGKKKEKQLLVLACYPSNTTFTHSLSFTLMAKTKTRRRKTTTTTTILKTR